MRISAIAGLPTIAIYRSTGHQTWAGFIYLAVVLDAWSRRVVGWAIGEAMVTELVLSALNMALQQRKPEGGSTTATRAASTPALPLETAARR
jgi:transposase InsO family protein